MVAFRENRALHYLAAATAAAGEPSKAPGWRPARQRLICPEAVSKIFSILSKN